MGLCINVIKPEMIFEFSAGSYSGFDNFRHRLAELSGIQLSKMQGHHGDIEWKINTPFVELLNHSDCDGRLSFDECKDLLDDFKNVEFQKIVAKEFKDFQEDVKNWIEALEEVLNDRDEETYINFC